MCQGVNGSTGSSAVLGNNAAGLGTSIATTAAGSGDGTQATANSLVSPMNSRFLTSGFGQDAATPAFDFASLFGGQSLIGQPSIFGGQSQSQFFTA